MCRSRTQDVRKAVWPDALNLDATLLTLLVEEDAIVSECLLLRMNRPLSSLLQKLKARFLSRTIEPAILVGAETIASVYIRH